MCLGSLLPLSTSQSNLTTRAGSCLRSADWGTECACQHCPQASREGSATGGLAQGVLFHITAQGLSCLGETGSYQAGVLCRRSARSLLGLLRRLLISHVYSMFSPRLAHDVHSNLPIHLLALESRVASSCPCQHLLSSCWHCLGRQGKVLHTGSRWWILPKCQGMARGLESNPDRCASWLVSRISPRRQNVFLVTMHKYTPL